VKRIWFNARRRLNVLRIRVARHENKTSPEGGSRHTILC